MEGKSRNMHKGSSAENVVGYISQVKSSKVEGEARCAVGSRRDYESKAVLGGAGNGQDRQGQRG